MTHKPIHPPKADVGDLVARLGDVVTDFDGMTREQAERITGQRGRAHDVLMVGLGYYLHTRYVPKGDRRWGDKATVRVYREDGVDNADVGA